MKSDYISDNAVEQFDALTDREKSVEIITFYRLHLYNRGVPCGAKAIRDKMSEENIKPLPSVSSISRILREQCLTHGRTGYYEEDYYNKDGLLA